MGRRLLDFLGRALWSEEHLIPGLSQRQRAEHFLIVCSGVYHRTWMIAPEYQLVLRIAPARSMQL